MRTRTYLILWTALAISVVLIVVLAGCSSEPKEFEYVLSATAKANAKYDATPAGSSNSRKSTGGVSNTGHNVATVYANMTATVMPYSQLHQHHLQTTEEIIKAGGVGGVGKPLRRNPSTNNAVVKSSTDTKPTAEAIAKSILATQKAKVGLSVANEELEEYLRTHIGPGQITGAEAIANVKHHLKTSRYSYLDRTHYRKTGERRYIETPCSYAVRDSYVATWNAAPDGPNSWYISATLIEGKTLFGYIVLGWTFYPATLVVDSHHDHATC